jgi:EmrB/QacA subfamily drug resistance transporter
MFSVAFRHSRYSPPRARALAQQAGATARSHWTVVATVCVGATMAALDASIVNVAMPTLRAVFQRPVAEVEWVALAYLLVLASLLTIFGRLGDLLGRSRIYLAGFAVFGLASAACGLAPSLGVLIAARAVQAIGASMMQSNSIALITAATPPQQRGRAIGIQGAAQATGLAIGPVAGGWLLSHAGWQWLFYVNVPIALLGIALGLRFLPVQQHRRQGRLCFDYLGAALFATAAFAGLLALSQGSEWGWQSTATMTAGAAALVALAGFLWYERRAAEPLVDLRLFTHPTIALGNLTGLLSYLLLYGTLFLVPFLLQDQRGLEPQVVGLLLAPVPLGLSLAAPLGGWLSDRLGPRVLTTAGMALGALAVTALAFQEGRPLGLLALALALLGVGMGLFTPPNNSSVMGAAPSSSLSVVGGLLNLTRSLGMSLGVALAGTLLVARLAAYAGASDPAQAHAAAYRDSFLALATLAALAALLSLLRAGGAPARHEGQRRHEALAAGMAE